MKLLITTIATTLFLIVVINLFVTLVIFIAEDKHAIDHVKIYELFEAKQYRQITKKIMKNNYTILIGDDQSGVKNYIEHQANIHTVGGRSVMIKQYKSASKEKQKLLKVIKETRFYMEVAFGMGREERTEIFFINNIDQLPLQQIEFIRQKYPTDNIIVVSDKPIQAKIKGFKQIVFPPVTIQQLKLAILQYYQYTPKQIKKIIEGNFQSVQNIFKYFKRRSYQEQESAAQQIVQVEDIEDLNELSHELAQKQRKKLSKSIKGSKAKK